MNPLTQIPIICGGTHYYTQHFLFPPSRLSLDRDAQDPAAQSRSKNTKWRPRCSVDDVLETLDRMDVPLAQRIRAEPGVREFLETFWTPRPVFPESWIPQDGPSSRGTGNPHHVGALVFSDVELLALHRLLGLVDEREAGRWHWRDGRKVKRGLERWWEGVEEVRRGKTDDDGEGSVAQERSRCVPRPGSWIVLIPLQVSHAHVLGIRRLGETGAALGSESGQDGRRESWSCRWS